MRLAALLANPLDYTLDYTPAYDLLRIFVIFVGVAIIARVGVMVGSGEASQSTRSAKSVMAVYLGLAVYLVTQQIETFGEDLLWWRLPLLIFIGVNALITLWSSQAVRGTHVNRQTTQYLVARAAIEDSLCDRDRLAGRPCTNAQHDHPPAPPEEVL